MVLWCTVMAAIYIFSTSLPATNGSSSVNQTILELSQIVRLSAPTHENHN